MARTKKKLTEEEKLAKDRLRKQKKYQDIKNNPELYQIQKEKDRMRYLLNKEKKKICSINDLSVRAQRNLRKRWRKNSLNYLKKKKQQKELESILVNNSAPESENEAENFPEVAVPVKNIPEPDPLALADESDGTLREKEIPRRCGETVSSSVLRISRYRAAKTIKTLKTEIEKLKREKDMYRKRTQQLQQKVQEQKILEDTLEKKVDGLIRDIKSDKIEEVKKKLLFDEHLSRTFKNTYQNLQKKEKRRFAEKVLPKNELLGKHRIKTKIPLPLRIRQKLAENRKNVTQKKKQELQTFYEDDANSRVAAGKKEFVKKRGEKKQKRYLNDNLKHLHNKFCKERGNVSYAVFCKYRPFWVVFPNNERDTCQCHLHANVNLLIKALHKSKIVSEASSTEVLNKLCCDPYNHKCLARSCKACQTKTLNYSEFNNVININYFEWERLKYENIGTEQNKNVKKIRTDKTKKEDNPRSIIIKLEAALPLFMKHTRNIVVQFSAIKSLKENLSSYEVLIHVDFSENYSLKYNEEVQSFHFGASRSHVSLHTVVMYYMEAVKGLTAKSICTISSCLNHDATAIWSHIKPLLDIAKQLVPALSKIHFLSDSPSSQYRNRFIFYMLTKIHFQVPTITNVTWNYQESGNGKGAPDGVGSTLKRTADNYVKYGGDIGSFEDFADLVTKTTTNVHQALWSIELPYSVTFRALSCFSCLSSFLLCDHQKHLGVLSTGFGQEARTANDLETSLHLDQFRAFNEENLLPLQIDSVLDSDNFSALDFGSDTILNNNEDDMFLNEIDGTLSWHDIPVQVLQPDPVPEREKPRIISNVKFYYQSYKSRKRKHKDQEQDYEHIIKSVKVQKSEEIDEKIVQGDIDERNQKKTERNKHKIDGENPIKEIHQEIINEFLNKTNQNILSNKEKEPKNYRESANESGFDGYQPTRSIHIDKNDKENILSEKTVASHYNLDDWVVVKYTILYISQGKSAKFAWPTMSDEDVVPISRIVKLLTQPSESRRGQFSFTGLPNFNFE